MSNSNVIYVPVDGEVVINTDVYGSTLILTPNRIRLSFGALGGKEKDITMDIDFPPDYVICLRVESIEDQGVNSDRPL